MCIRDRDITTSFQFSYVETICNIKYFVITGVCNRTGNYVHCLGDNEIILQTKKLMSIRGRQSGKKSVFQFANRA